MMIDNTTVADIMSDKIITVFLEDRFSKIKAAFEEYEIHHLLVINKGELKGIISTNDLIKAYTSDGDKEELTASDLMTSYPLTIDMSDNIGLAADIILANKFHAIPVMDGSDLVGIITSHDLIKFSFDL